MSGPAPPSNAITGVLEWAIARGRALRLRLKETVDFPAQIQEVDPLALETGGGAQYLRYRIRSSGLETRVRLDRIKSAEESGS